MSKAEIPVFFLKKTISTIFWDTLYLVDCANNSEVAIEDDSDGENYESGNDYDERDKG